MKIGQVLLVGVNGIEDFPYSERRRHHGGMQRVVLGIGGSGWECRGAALLVDAVRVAVPASWG
jgi:hypothetical protein